MKTKLLALTLMLCLLGCTSNHTGSNKKILLIQSYWPNYSWVNSIDKGVLAGLNIAYHNLNKPLIVSDGIGTISNIKSDRNIDLTILYMDTKRHPDEEWKIKSADFILKKIESINPDVILLADDNTQKYIGTKIVNKYPIVFCGVNNDYLDYYNQKDKVTGLHERLYFVDTVWLFKKIFPKTTHLVLLTDNTMTSSLVLKQFQKSTLPFEKVESHSFKKFSAFKDKVLSLQTKKNTAIAIFNLNFENSTQAESVKWFLNHSRLPEMTFQENTIRQGLLLTSAVSGVTHGLEGIRLAIRILHGEAPKSIPVSIPRRGNPMINTARAKMLNLTIPDTILNQTQIIKEIEPAP